MEPRCSSSCLNCFAVGFTAFCRARQKLQVSGEFLWNFKNENGKCILLPPILIVLIFCELIIRMC